MAFFTDGEIEQLRLARISLHILGAGVFEPQPELAVEHDDFLLDVLRDIASDSVYEFVDASTTKATIEAIARRDVAFEAGSQKLAEDFARFHEGGVVKNGAFFVFELGVDDEAVSLYGLVKYDYAQVLEVVQNEGATGLRRIVEAFVRDRASIQKAAIVRCVDGIANPALSTRDRMGRPAPNLTDYFLGYLQVARTRSDGDLTKEVRDVIRHALNDNREFLPPGSVAAAVAKANNVVRDAPLVTEEVVKQAVWVGAGQPDDESIQNKFSTSVARLLKKKRLTGLQFTPDKASIPTSERRVVKTQEGVLLEYQTALEGGAVQKMDLGDGRTQFTVTTQGYTDGVIAERTRRTT